jgi:F0F1-type ATP synthase gamma subunit
MSESLGGLRRKIDGAGELGSVVRTMKALAASSIGQYEKAVLSLNDYYRTVQLGLVACLRQPRSEYLLEEEARPDAGPTSAFVFGSDQGLVGPFNDVLAAYAATTLAAKAGKKDVWAVGSRVEACLADVGLPSAGLFVSLFRACIESLTSENASRLAAMQRAEKNIDDLLEELNRRFHRLRQSAIDDELFDVISGYESLSAEKRAPYAKE